MKKSVFILFICLSFILSSCSQKSDFVSEKAKYDIEVVKLDIGEYILKDLYNPEPLNELEDDLIHKNISRDEAVIRLSKILADYNVGHLNLSPDYPEFYNEMAPFGMIIFDDDFYINYIPKEYEKYLGCKVLQVGGIPVKEALEKYNQFFSYETASGAKYSFESSLNYKFLKAAGLLDKKGKLSLGIETQPGNMETVSFKSVEKITADEVAILKPEAHRSIDINLNAKKFSAGVSDLKNKTYYYQSLSFNNLYFEDNSVEVLEEMIKELSQNEYDTIVFDLRYNGGGIFPWITQSKLYEYKDVLEKYNIAVVISGRTYSAGVIFVDYLYKLFPNLVFFGEETGQAIFNYTNVLPETLPNLKCHIVFPKQVEPMEYVSARASDVNRGILPDVEVHQTFEDSMNGIDTIYNAIHEYFQSTD